MFGTREGTMAKRAMIRAAFYTAIVGLLVCAVPLRGAFAQGTTVNAGGVSVDEGTTAAVPISIVLPAGQTCATLQFNLTVVPGSGAPALTQQVTFTNATSNPTSQNIANGLSTRLVGWFSNFDPLLTGTVALGTLNVPIPAGAGGTTYTVQVIAPSGTSDVDNTIDIDPISGANGTITVNPVGPAGTTVNAGNVTAAAGTTAEVPISIVLPAEQTCATLQFNLTVVPGSGAPVLTEQVTFTNATSNPTSQNIANGLSTRLVGWFSNFDPLLTGTVALGTLNVPIPADASGVTYTVQVIAPSGTSDVDNTIDIDPISGVNGTITVSPPASATLTTSIGATDTCIPVSDTSIFSPTGGFALVGTELISYTGIGTSCPGAGAAAAGALTGVTRNLNGQGGAHDAGTTVVPAQAPPATSTPTSTATAAPSATPTSTAVASATPTKPPATATPTATRTPTGGACPGCPEDDDGCQITAPGNTPAWLLLVPAIGLLVVRRKRR
jgi:hypothetical protein